MANFWATSVASYISARLFSPSGAAGPFSGPAGDQDDQAAAEYAAELLAHARAEVDRADNKAQILLAGTGVAAGALGSGLLAGSWSPLSLGAAVQWLWWLGVAAGVAGTALLAAAVYPRPGGARTPGSSAVAYFGDVGRFRSAGELAAALRASVRHRLRMTAGQLRTVSRIVELKYRAIRWAMWLLAAALASCGAAVLLDPMA